MRTSGGNRVAGTSTIHGSVSQGTRHSNTWEGSHLTRSPSPEPPTPQAAGISCSLCFSEYRGEAANVLLQKANKATPPENACGAFPARLLQCPGAQGPSASEKLQTEHQTGHASFAGGRAGPGRKQPALLQFGGLSSLSGRTDTQESWTRHILKSQQLRMHWPPTPPHPTPRRPLRVSQQCLLGIDARGGLRNPPAAQRDSSGYRKATGALGGPRRRVLQDLTLPWLSPLPWQQGAPEADNSLPG